MADQPQVSPTANWISHSAVSAASDSGCRAVSSPIPNHAILQFLIERKRCKEFRRTVTRNEPHPVA